MSNKLGVSICLILLIVWSESSFATSSRPNIIFVLADDLGYNDIGYHSDQILTPHLDKLAAGGIKLENYYVQPICSPTRSTLMSGRYQIHTGLTHFVILPTQANGLPTDSPTMADKMKEAGYSTHMVGKWHIGFFQEKYCPWKRGFDTYLGYLTGNEDYWTHTHFGYLDFRSQNGPVKNMSGDYSAHLFTNRAIDIVREHKTSDKPLFLYLAYQSVHFPLQVPDKYKKKYPKIQNKPRRNFAGMVSALDEGVKNLTDVLKETGMWNNTIFVFSTDNGGSTEFGGNNYPLRGEKCTLWEGGLHGVGFVTGGRVKQSGVINREMIHVSDWFPTLVGQAGGNLHGTKPLDGFDQWDAITGKATSKRDTILHNIDVLWKYGGQNSTSKLWDTRIRAALRQGDFKIITGNPGMDQWVPEPTSDYVHPVYERLPRNWVRAYEDGTIPEDFRPTMEKPDKNVWLFNIREDPNERNDISDENPEIVNSLLALLKRYNDTSVEPRFPPKDMRADPQRWGNVWTPWL